MKTPRIRHARHREFDGAERGSAGVKRLRRHDLFLANRATAFSVTAAAVNFTASGSSAVNTSNGHGFVTGDGPYRASSTTTRPAGIETGVDYWIRAIDANTFSLHPSRREAGLDLNAVETTDTGTGTHSVALGEGREAVNDYLRQGADAQALRALTDVDNALGLF